MATTTSPPASPPTLPRLGLRGAIRWVWRQLTSMRVALMLLMLLAVVAVPGSILPQRPQDAAAVARYLADNPDWGPLLDRLGFFDVYGSVWFSAVYLLLFVSLVGCILPRIGAHARAWRARPPRAPRRFDRFEVHETLSTEAGTDEVLAAAHRALRGGRRFRVEPGEEPGGARTLSAERGYFRETGNIVFHLALVGLLISVATGQLLHYRGQVLVVEGRGFANTPSAYDTFDAGSGVDTASLVPFTVELNSFTASFDSAGRPTFFEAAVSVTEPDQATRDTTIRVNRPLDAGGAKIYLAGNGYAPQLTVRDSDGNVAFEGPVPFLPQDASYRSRGVVKVPDVTSGDQIGLVGYLLPTAVITEDSAYSAYPQPGNPVLVLQVWRGDLGLDSGVPQNVYQLDTAGMAQVSDADGTPVTVVVPLGEEVELPGGLGTLSFDGLPRYVALDMRYDPSLGWVLAFALTALVGLAVSLFTPRRRVWLRVASDGERRTVEAAALARADDGGLAGEVERVLDAVRELGPWSQPDPDAAPTAAHDSEDVDEPR
ncbi:cytochrome c biogenesis protein ResB [Actinotalea sp. M2MS4P-6]|uniref:cytochrome c biogenesis protein ResB n=1 Tax=Actinotalea sp. M2MS4P-6 TaxID=2983762 RepID=UPI0021E3C506|nr:cytochrome c biogenesis protein ResB [Actinotalea sp. M2MS4P-6]MCV2394874.1 cytochrome c biogenesis protein ResB [Actinotalea sp. M2MS4P-6]